MAHFCEMMIYPGFYFHCSEIFIFLAVRGVKVKSIAQNENNHYIHLAPHLWNGIADDHDFWYTYVKWMMISSGAFFHFDIFIFLCFQEGKKTKKCPRWQNNSVCWTLCLRNHASHQGCIWSWLLMNMYKRIVSPCPSL